MPTLATIPRRSLTSEPALVSCIRSLRIRSNANQRSNRNLAYRWYCNSLCPHVYVYWRIDCFLHAWLTDVLVVVADQHPSASVIGTDLSPIQPSWVPINVRMFIEDSEEPEWLHGSEFDLVHFRQMTDVLRDLKGLLTKIYPFVPPFMMQSHRAVKDVTDVWRIDMSRTAVG